MWETWVWSLGGEDSLEKETATHSSTLGLKIPWTEELGAGYYPWGHKESGMTEQLHFHTVKAFGIVNKAETDVLLKLFCFFSDWTNVGNLISDSSAFLKMQLEHLEVLSSCTVAA